MSLPGTSSSTHVSGAASVRASALPVQAPAPQPKSCFTRHWSQIFTAPLTLAGIAATAMAFYAGFPIIGGLAAATTVGSGGGFIIAGCMAPRKALDNQLADLGTIDTDIAAELTALRELKRRVDEAAQKALVTTSDAAAAATMTVEQLIEQNALIAGALATTQKRIDSLGALLIKYQKLVEGMNSNVEALNRQGQDLGTAVGAAGDVAIHIGTHAGDATAAATIIEREQGEFETEQAKFAEQLHNYQERIALLQATIREITTSKAALAERVSQLENVEEQLATTQARVAALTERFDLVRQTLEARMVDIDEAHEVKEVDSFIARHLAAGTGLVATSPAILPVIVTDASISATAPHVGDGTPTGAETKATAENV